MLQTDPEIGLLSISIHRFMKYSLSNRYKPTPGKVSRHSTGSRIRILIFLPIPDPGVNKGTGSQIRILNLYPSRIQGSKRNRIQDPGSGFATLVWRYTVNKFLFPGLPHLTGVGRGGEATPGKASLHPTSGTWCAEAHHSQPPHEGRQSCISGF